MSQSFSSLALSWKLSISPKNSKWEEIQSGWSGSTCIHNKNENKIFKSWNFVKNWFWYTNKKMLSTKKKRQKWQSKVILMYLHNIPYLYIVVGIGKTTVKIWILCLVKWKTYFPWFNNISTICWTLKVDTGTCRALINTIIFLGEM